MNLILFFVFFVSLFLISFSPSSVHSASLLHRQRRSSSSRSKLQPSEVGHNDKFSSVFDYSHATTSALTMPKANPDKLTDCTFRRFAVEYSSYLQTTAVYDVASAMQLGSFCNMSLEEIPKVPARKITKPISRIGQTCSWQVYVDGTMGNDKNSGTITSPFKTVTYALGMSRARDPGYLTACITIRAGTYYLGQTKGAYFGNSKDSQIGVIALTSADSGLTIAAYENEQVIFSGGYELTNLNWQPYKQVEAGQIMMAQLPSDVALDYYHFNELYVTDNNTVEPNWRAVRAKYPNGDPSIYNSFDWISGAAAWGPIVHRDPAVEIHVATPATNSTMFPGFQIGIGGPALSFDPPHSFWALAHPPGGGGSTYVIPSSITYDSRLPHAVNYSDATTAYVHAFHCGHWGSWVFTVSSHDPSSKTLVFEKGGYQEARGCTSGSEYYISNVLEELDAPLEWFVDAKKGVLYFLPNQTTMPTSFVASQAPCIISLHGDSVSPVSDVTISGITFTHTPNTFMRAYETPSGGDWSVHRGGSIFLTGTAYVTIINNRFVNLGNTGITISDWNLNATIQGNQMKWLGDSGIILVGSTDGIDGVSNLNQPTNTHVESNLIHETGIYIKQSAPIFHGVTRSSVISGNAFFNVPRACLNFNGPTKSNTAYTERNCVLEIYIPFLVVVSRWFRGWNARTPQSYVQLQ